MMQAEHVINAVDANGDGRVDEAEFMKVHKSDCFSFVRLVS